jgi:hypothetical protein
LEACEDVLNDGSKIDFDVEVALDSDGDKVVLGSSGVGAASVWRCPSRALAWRWHTTWR